VARFNAKSDGVNVEGLAELRRALKAVSADAPKELNAASKEVASFVADDARSAAAGLGGVAAKVAPSISPSGTARGGAINLGGASYPMALGAEFGGRGRPTTQQFQPHLGRTGYFVYPTIRRDGDRIESEFSEKLDDLMRKYDLL
jgi:hypothetical protein